MASDSHQPSRRRRHRRVPDTGRREGAAERLKRRRKGRYLISDGSRTRSGSNRRAFNRISWLIFAIVTAAGVVLYLKAPKHKTRKPVPEPVGEVVTVETAPENDELFIQLSELLDANQWEEAEPLLTQFKENAPDYPGLLFRQAQYHHGLGESETALELAKESIARNQEVYLSHFLIAVILAQKEEYAASLPHFESASELAPWNANVLRNWGAALRRQGKLDDALDIYERARALKPGMAIIMLKVHLIYLEQGKVETTRNYATDLLRWTPDNATGILLQAALNLHDGRYAEAAQGIAAMQEELGDSAISNLMDDPYFAKFAERPEMAPFLNTSKGKQVSVSGEEPQSEDATLGEEP